METKVPVITGVPVKKTNSTNVNPKISIVFFCSTKKISFYKSGGLDK